ncbi:MAG: maleylpyruvate isomerase family mycothiol-dependent enzyme [Acidimicrobiia bacterium]
MDEIITALAAQQDEFAGVLAGRDDADWLLPSSCEGWTIADVVLHLAQTNELAIASIGHDLPAAAERLGAGDGRASTVDENADAMVAAQRDVPVAELRDRWQAGVDRLQILFSSADLHDRVPWVAGELSVQTLAATRLAETWIHTGDIAEPLGVTLPPTDRLKHVARLAWRTLPYAFARAGRELAGPVAFELVSPGGKEWSFVPDDAEPVTVLRGDGAELCLLAAQRLRPGDTSLHGDGVDVDSVLELVRTYA